MLFEKRLEEPEEGDTKGQRGRRLIDDKAYQGTFGRHARFVGRNFLGE